MEFGPRTFVWRLNLGGDLLPHSVASGAMVFEFGLRICVRRVNLGGGIFSRIPWHRGCSLGLGRVLGWGCVQVSAQRMASLFTATVDVHTVPADLGVVGYWVGAGGGVACALREWSVLFWGGHVSPVFRSTGLVSGADTSYVGYVGGI